MTKDARPTVSNPASLPTGPQPHIMMFHKPTAVVVTRSDERGRRTVYDVLPDWVHDDGWVPVGRLDRDSRGLLLLVRDPRLVEVLGAPGRQEKEYDVRVRGWVGADHLDAARAGVITSIGTLGCSRVEVLGCSGPTTRLRVILTEGRNRHIRRLFGALLDTSTGRPLKVLDLKRTRIGPLVLDVPSGHWRFLTAAEEDALLGRASPSG